MSKASATSTSDLDAANIKGHVDAETLADLICLAEHMDCTVDHLVATAVHRFVNKEIGAINPDGVAHLPPRRDPSPTGRALDKAQYKARMAMRAFLKVGEDAIERGDVISHEDLMAELRALDEGAVEKKRAA